MFPYSFLKKISIISICFCLLFYQNIFAVANIANDSENPSIFIEDIPSQNKELEDISSTSEEAPKIKEDTSSNTISENDNKNLVTTIENPPNNEPTNNINLSEKQNITTKTETKNDSEKIIPPITTQQTQKDVFKKDMLTESEEIISEQDSSTKQKILITKIQLDTSSSTHEEYIELYNLTEKEIDLKNYTLKKYSKSNNCTQKSTYLVSSRYFKGTIKPHDFFIITHKDFSDAPWADLTFSSKNYTIAKNSSIVLYDDNDAVVDIVGIGDVVNCFEGTPAPIPSKNEALQRRKEHNIFVDTDNNNSDFFINTCPFPGNFQPANTFTNIRINEIYPNPCKKDDTHCIHTEEFIELYNPNNFSVSLDKWRLTDSSSVSGNINNIVLKGNSFTKLTKQDFKFTLNNDGDSVSLISPICSIVSTVSYTNSQKGRSLNYGKSWYWAEPSPQKENFPDPKTISYPQLLLSELLANPSTTESTDEFIEIYNPTSLKINLKNWELKDASKSGSYIFMQDTYINSHSFFVIYRKDFKFALNNSNETVSLIAPNEKIMSSIFYESAKENVSYNYDLNTKKWRWSKHLTPNRENIFNNLPTITKFKINKKSYKNVYTQFHVKAVDLDGEKLKVRWDFGDNHKSYLWETNHKYDKVGIYHGNVRIQDGSEEIIKDFTIIVKKYPKYDVTITKILPNPSGKDTNNEYIVIKNKSKKDLNLKNWSIATGTSDKTLTNHPIYNDLIIKKGKTKTIKHKYAAITLPNKKGVVEVRRPNGKVSDKQKYGDKDIPIPDNAYYEKIDTQWQWIIPQDSEKNSQSNAIIVQALKNEQILSQQKLESLIAYTVIYTATQDDKLQKTTNHSLTEKINIYINKLINKTIFAWNQFNKRNTRTIAQVSPSYTIQINSNPCAQPSLYKSNKLHFCK